MNFRRIDNKNMYVANRGNISVLKSYNKIIVIEKDGEVFINSEYHDYSRTTAKHRNLYLGVTSKEFEANCRNGKYFFITDKEIQEMFYSIE